MNEAKPLKYLSVCSGIEAATMAWHHLGWSPVAFSEIEPFASALLATKYPDVPNLGDMTKYGQWNPPSFDVLVGGTPCFVGHTLIITRRGLIPIREVIPGDEVLTHEHRWRKVLATGSKLADTVLVRGQGQSTGIETTPEHPFYARMKSRVWVGRENGSWKSGLGEPSWIDAQEMTGRMWASPATWPESGAPPIETKGNEHAAPTMTDDLAWIIGRWLGDGWCRINRRRGYVLICCGKHEAGSIEERLTAAGLAFNRSEERTTYRFGITNRALARWLKMNFGTGAATKTMPTWVFGWERREHLLAGYISADGCKVPSGYRITTVSAKLALGAVLLAHTLGKSASRRLSTPKRKKCYIEGRLVNERPSWQVTIPNSARSSMELDGHRWGRVRHVDPHGHAPVFNLEVEEDNSYVADGIVVHNCQSFSVAGLRKGFTDPRGNLALTYLAILDRFRPRWCVWENVPGVLSSSGGRDFGSFLGGLVELGYGFAYRVLDAEYVRVESHPRAVPQRRRRVFVVGCSGGWERAAEVLLEPEGVRGNSPPRRKTRQVAPRRPVPGPQGGSRPEAVAPEEEILDAEPIVLENGAGKSAVCTSQNGACYTLTTGDGNASHIIAFPTGRIITAPVSAPLRRAIPGTDGLSGESEQVVGFIPDPEESAFSLMMRESGKGYWIEDDVAGTLDGASGTARPALVAQPGPENLPVDAGDDSEEDLYTLAIRGRGQDRVLEYRQDGVANALLTPNGGRDGIGVGAIAQTDGSQVPIPLTPDPYTQEVARTLDTGCGHMGSRMGVERNFILEPGDRKFGIPDPAYTICASETNQGRDAQDTYVIEEDPEAPRLDLNGGICFDPYNQTVNENVSYPLRVGLGTGQGDEIPQTVSAIPIQNGVRTERSQNGLGIGDPDDPAFTLDTFGEQAVGVSQTTEAYPSRMRVRRLTPRECERLQGFPETEETAILSVCPDPRNGLVSVALSCRGWRDNALRAAAAGSQGNVILAEPSSSISHPVPELLVALLVPTDYAEPKVEIRRPARSSASAQSAGITDWSPLPTLVGSSVLSVVQAVQGLVRETITGKAGSLPFTLRSTAARSGTPSVMISGPETEGTAAGAVGDPQPGTFTTSVFSQVTPTSDSPLETWCCSVLNAIAGFTPVATWPGSFLVEVSTRTPFTLIQYNGKPASDGYRYKALGNSMAVNVMRFIGERIALYEKRHP